jgi:uridylate kinase
MNERPYKRVLLKLSGEALKGDHDFGYDLVEVQRIVKEIKELYVSGVQISIVVGGGNIFRGAALSAQENLIDRASCDYMGMLATVMNAIAIQSALEKIDIPTRVLSAIPMTTICEPYIRRKAIRHMEKGRIVIFAAGTGNPFFSTDTAAALRAIEMNCDLLMKATNVDGVYSADPKHTKDAKRYAELSYNKVLTENLKVIDASAIALARENHLPIIIFSIHDKGNMIKIVKKQGKFTIIK